MSRPKLVAFDFDSTLMDGETIDLLAGMAGKRPEVSEITERAMQGELDFFEALTARVQLLAGLEYAKVCELCRVLPLMPGALEAVAAVKAQGYRVLVFSGGFREATEHHARVMGADADFANFLHHRDGRLTGRVGGEMMANDSKGKMLKRIRTLLGVSVEDTVAVGDGANDLSLFKEAGTKIAFCAKPVLKAAADHVVDTKDMREILAVLPTR